MGESSIPLTGKLIASVITNFAYPPVAGDDSWPQMSIGCAEDSIVATDSLSAIIIGKNADSHTATLRKEALLAAFRAKTYGEAVAIDDIERKVDAETGEREQMPPIQEIITRGLGGMRSVARIDPSALVSIGKVAVAAGAHSVELFQPVNEGDKLGFKFTFSPDTSHVNLFSVWDGDIEARGIFQVGKTAAYVPSEPSEEGSGEKITVAARKTKGPAPKVVTVPADNGIDDVEETVTVTIDCDERRERDGYKLPAISTLTDISSTEKVGGEYKRELQEVFRANNIPASIAGVNVGPTISQYLVEVPAGGKLINKIVALADEMQSQLEVMSVRVQAPIPGKKAIGIEVPNKTRRVVGLRELCARPEFVDAPERLWIALGCDVAGKPVYADLASTPHLLIAGATNSGKSIGIATLLTSLLIRNTPKDVRLILIDPKQVELSLFQGLPHLMCPVITDCQEAAGVLRAVVREMERRLSILKEAGSRNISGFNAKASYQDRMPFIVVVIDELADLMMRAGQQIEASVVMIAQKARAVGIHLVIATQRPSVDVVTGLIKANVPSRIAFGVASQVDSRVILDSVGAEKLLSRGDMLWSPIEGGGKQTRVQGGYISEDEVAAVCRAWTKQESPAYEIDPAEPEEYREPAAGEGDDLYADAVDFVKDRGQASTSMLQRKFSIGFQRSTQLLDRMEREEIVGPRVGPEPRKVLIGANGGSK